MARFSYRLFIACILIGFGIFFGVEIAKNGIEHINGPFVQQTGIISEGESAGERQLLEQVNQAVAHEKVEAPQADTVQLQTLRPVPADKAIHKLASKTEQVLESSLQSGVELIVSLFEIIVY